MEGSLIIENTENHLEVEMVEKDNKMASKEKKECDCDEKSDKKNVMNVTKMIEQI